MRHTARLAAALAIAGLGLAACGSSMEERVATGALGGAAVGGLTQGGLGGAAVGAAVGAAGGAVVDRVKDD